MNKSSPHILIVDDNPQNLQVTAKILKDNGYLISLALDAKSALNLLNNIEPDLILLDIMMPEMDGIEACRLIKNRPKTTDVPIIFLTAKNETLDLIAGFQAGGVDYITKPFNQEELLVRVNTHIELFNSKKKVVELSQSRDKIYSIIAHDIRSPLSSIQQTLNYIAEGIMEPGSENFTDIIHLLDESTKETMALLDNLLAWAKFQSGSISIKPKQTNISKLLIDCTQLYASLAKGKSISINIDIPKNIEAFIDELTMHTVFRNLISNSIKFTPDNGKIDITAYIKESTVMVTLTDNGVGMSSEVLKKIFESKEQHSTNGTRNEHGTGFGLIVIKEFVEKNKGSLDVKSEENKGTTFFIEIPSSKQ